MLSQPAEGISPANRFCCFAQLAVMTAAAEGVPHLARKASLTLTINLEGAAALWSKCDRQPGHFSEWNTILLAQKQMYCIFFLLPSELLSQESILGAACY